jgi:hypothetical protein
MRAIAYVPPRDFQGVKTVGDAGDVEFEAN